MGIVSKWKLIVVVIVLVGSAWYLYPTIRWYSMTPDNLTELQKIDYPSYKWLNDRKLNLGLDLQGGVSLLLRIDTETLEINTLDKEIERLNNEFINKGHTLRADFSPNSTSVIIPYENAEQSKIIEDIIADSIILVKRESPSGQLEYMIDVRQTSTKVQETMEQARQVIENRINELGVSESPVSMVGNDRIAVELPGEQDPERARGIIQRQAFLEFKLVAEDVLLNNIIDEQGKIKSGAIVPDGYELKYLKDISGGEISRTPILIRKRAELTGDHITRAMVRRDSFTMGAPYVELELDRDGARIFERVTGANINKRLAIILDGEVQSAPNIQERIPGGRARITGQFTEAEAKDLALVLRAGSLPAPMVIEESRVVGPSLGYDSIRKGVLSALIGGLLVVAFMVVYYKGSGIIANIALLLNLIILIAAMGALNATLTVPGIAGIVLTIGMAVDANVLIFERIREELRSGKTPHAAIESGYNRAFTAIFDSNVTTIIAAFMLLQFGSGAVKGFAITLMVGILISMFTAILVTRMIFEWLSLRPGFKKISI